MRRYTSHRDSFLGSVIKPNVVGARLLLLYHNLENILKTESSKS